MSIEETGIAIRSYLKTAFFSKNGIDIIVATFVVCRIKITDRRWWPNDRMYCESCASVGLMMFGQRMAALTGDGKYYDIVERALCNTVLGGISAEGDRYFYVTPLEVWPDNCLSGTSMAHVKPIRQSWFGVACCPSNIARTQASVGQYIFAQDEKSIYINQFLSASLETEIRGTRVMVDLQSDLMRSGSIHLVIETNQPQSFTLRIRIPEYWKEPVFILEGKTIAPVVENGYAAAPASRQETSPRKRH